MKQSIFILFACCLLIPAAYARVCPPGTVARVKVVKRCRIVRRPTYVTRRVCRNVRIRRPRMSRCRTVWVRRVRVRRVCNWRGRCRIVRVVRRVPTRVCRSGWGPGFGYRRVCSLRREMVSRPRRVCTVTRRVRCVRR